MAAAEDPVGTSDPVTTTSSAPSAALAEAAFRVAYDEHLPEIWRFVRRRTDGAEDADDVTADVFAVAWRRRHELPPGDESRMWLYGVARRVLANQQRSARRRQRLHLRVADAATTTLDRSPDPADGPDGDALWHALSTLHDDDRELLLLRSWDGLAVTDLAALLGCTPNAASLRLHKARQRLAAALDATRTSGAVQTDPRSTRTSRSRSRNPSGGAR